MRKINLNQFVELIEVAISMGERTDFCITEKEDKTFLISSEGLEDIALEAEQESIYDDIFDTLRGKYNHNKQVYWFGNVIDGYIPYIRIDDFVVVKLDYKLRKGRRWLLLHNGDK